MASTNTYGKHYSTNRRSTNDDNKYVLILFKSDNTFIIKKKSNLHGVDENGLVNIKDRGRSYTGYCLLEGSLVEIETAAERLDKQMNTDLESDCEAVISISKSNAQRSRQLSTPTPLSKSSIEIGGSSSTKTNIIQKKTDNNHTQPKIRSLAFANLDRTSTNYETPPPTDIAVQNKRMRETSPKQVTYSACDTLGEVNDMVKNTKNGRQTRKIITFDDDCSDHESDNDQSSEEVIALDNSSSSKSITNNKKHVRPTKRTLSNSFTTTARDKPSKRLCNKFSPSEDIGNKEIIMLLKTVLLSIDYLTKDVNQSLRDIKNLKVSVEKVDNKMDVLFENQRKMQRALTKKKINVPLNGTYFGDENESILDPPFQPTLIHKNQNGETIDLLQLYGVKTQLGRFAALVMDHLFTKEELTTITKDELLNDERYQTIKEAVRSRFKLNHEMLNLEWPTLHESILQKRRNEIKKKRNSTGNVESAGSVPQATEEEHFDDENISNTF